MSPDSRVHMGRKDRREVLDFEIVLEPDQPAPVQSEAPEAARVGRLRRVLRSLTERRQAITVPPTSVGQPLPQVIRIREAPKAPQVRRVVRGKTATSTPRNHRAR